MSIEITTLLSKALRIYFAIFAEILSKFTGLQIPVGFELNEPLDQRIAKIDEAKSNLQEALSALDQLSKEAENNKAELAQALKELEKTKAEHALEEKHLNNIKNIAQSDIESFRRLAGLPNQLRERVVGFLAGIVASLIAAAIWQLGVILFD